VCLLVDVVFNAQQVIAHGLQGELVEDGGHRVEGPVQDDELGAGLIRTLNPPGRDTDRETGREGGQTGRQTTERVDR
jgi:hypothetical protein